MTLKRLHENFGPKKFVNSLVEPRISYCYVFKRAFHPRLMPFLQKEKGKKYISKTIQVGETAKGLLSYIVCIDYNIDFLSSTNWMQYV